MSGADISARFAVEALSLAWIESLTGFIGIMVQIQAYSMAPSRKRSEMRQSASRPYCAPIGLSANMTVYKADERLLHWPYVMRKQHPE
jgi:hypothetical protein